MLKKRTKEYIIFTLQFLCISIKAMFTKMTDVVAQRKTKGKELDKVFKRLN